MKKILIATLMISGMALADKPAGKTAAAGKDKITGEVVDITCYANHGAKGEKHAACAQKCLHGRHARRHRRRRQAVGGDDERSLVAVAPSWPRGRARPSPPKVRKSRRTAPTSSRSTRVAPAAK